MRRLLRDNELSIAMFGVFFFIVSAQSIMGLLDYNRPEEHGQPPVGYVQNLGSGDFVEAIFENWESIGVRIRALAISRFRVASPGPRHPEQA